MRSYVSYITDVVSIKNADSQSEKALHQFGVTRDSRGDLKIPFASKQQLADVLAALRDQGIPFSAGPDWSPSEQFEELRARGLIQGPFDMIIWHGANDFRIIKK